MRVIRKGHKNTQKIWYKESSPSEGLKLPVPDIIWCEENIWLTYKKTQITIKKEMDQNNSLGGYYKKLTKSKKNVHVPSPMTARRK